MWAAEILKCPQHRKKCFPTSIPVTHPQVGASRQNTVSTRNHSPSRFLKLQCWSKGTCKPRLTTEKAIFRPMSVSQWRCCKIEGFLPKSEQLSKEIQCWVTNHRGEWSTQRYLNGGTSSRPSRSPTGVSERLRFVVGLLPLRAFYLWGKHKEKITVQSALFLWGYILDPQGMPGTQTVPNLIYMMLSGVTHCHRSAHFLLISSTYNVMTFPS